jgi:DNA-binding response OmpR family regulator
MQLYYVTQDSEKNESGFFNDSPRDGDQEENGPGLLDNVKILIVDDNESFLESLSASLKDLKIDCVDVKSGREAIEAVKRESFDLILLDVVMDDMDGLDTYRALRRLGSFCPIIFMSAFYDEHEKDIQGLKPFAVLRKPFDLSQLIVYITRASGRGGQQDNGAEH